MIELTPCFPPFSHPLSFPPVPPPFNRFLLPKSSSPPFIPSNPFISYRFLQHLLPFTLFSLCLLSKFLLLFKPESPSSSCCLNRHSVSYFFTSFAHRGNPRQLQIAALFSSLLVANVDIFVFGNFPRGFRKLPVLYMQAAPMSVRVF